MSVSCGFCGDNRHLRFNRDARRYECVGNCRFESTIRPRRASSRPTMFAGYWLTANGERLRRVTRAELQELHRLWRVHRDIRERRAS